MSEKIITLSQLKKILKRRCASRVVFTNGCFDILHVGHIRYLKRARALGDLLIVGLNSDASTKRIKGKMRPINPQKERAEVLAALESVDYVIIFNEVTPLRLIQAIQPHVLVKGADWTKKTIIGKDFVESCGGKVATIPYVKNRSTSALIKTIIRIS